MQSDPSKKENGLRLLSLNENIEIKKDQQKYKQFLDILNNKLLETYFQPIVELGSGKNIGYEVFNRPELSNIFPSVDVFYDFVGRTSEQYQLDHISHVLAMDRFAKFVPFPRDSNLFLNTFPQTLIHYLENKTKLYQLLDTYKISAENVVFEISEKVKINDYARMSEVIEFYRSEGFRIALDDVGSGYNNLQTLIQLKPDFIKMDRAFIQNIDEDRVKQQIIDVLLDFTCLTDSLLVAEGIERLEEMQYLKSRGVHIGQGYVIGKPSKEVMTGKLPEKLYKVL